MQINGQFAYELNADYFLHATATVNKTKHGVSLEVPAGSVSGSMDSKTAVDLGNALVAAGGGTVQAPQAAPQGNPNLAGSSLVNQPDGSVQLVGKGGTVLATYRPATVLTFAG